MKTETQNPFRKKDEGAIGIGTLIVFIAMVLVATIAATVLVKTADTLQSRAQRTGLDAAEDTSIGINVLMVEGQYEGTSDNEIDVLKATICLYAGASAVEITDILVHVAVVDSTDSEAETEWYTSSGAGDAEAWNSVESLLDPNSNYLNNNMLDQDSIVSVTFDVPGAVTLGPRSSVEITFFIGAGGVGMGTTVYTPGAYNAQDNQWLLLE